MDPAEATTAPECIPSRRTRTRQAEGRADLPEVKILAMSSRHRGDVLEIPWLAGEDLHGDQVFRAHHGDRDTADRADLGAGQELLLETWAREHDVNGHPRGAVRERHDPRGFDEPRVGDEKLEAASRQDLDQVVGRAGAELYCDVHVSAEAGDAVEDRGLGAKQEPAQASAVERAAKVGEDVSDRLSGR